MLVDGGQPITTLSIPPEPRSVTIIFQTWSVSGSVTVSTPLSPVAGSATVPRLAPIMSNSSTLPGSEYARDFCLA